jgi:hypothetical protein
VHDPFTKYVVFEHTQLPLSNTWFVEQLPSGTQFDTDFLYPLGHVFTQVPEKL